MVEEWLPSADHNVLPVRSLNSAMTDSDIPTLAVQDQRLIIPMDKDFGELVVHSRRPHAGGLLLRLDDADSAEKVQVVSDIFQNHSDLLTGNYCVYQNGRLRVRRM
jgi:predicted nuclease of predicted toxin-antitoxin system